MIITRLMFSFSTSLIKSSPGRKSWSYLKWVNFKDDTPNYQELTLHYFIYLISGRHFICNCVSLPSYPLGDIWQFSFTVAAFSRWSFWLVHILILKRWTFSIIVLECLTGRISTMFLVNKDVIKIWANRHRTCTQVMFDLQDFV